MMVMQVWPVAIKEVIKVAPSGKKYKSVHIAENLILIATMKRRDGKGFRLFFRCPTRHPDTQPTQHHLFSVNDDGSNPKCSCPGFWHLQYCGLSNDAEHIAAMHRP